MVEVGTPERQLKVAPLTGSVDRNPVSQQQIVFSDESLPSRGAWIEIMCTRSRAYPAEVAPLTGSVDRNLIWGAFGGGWGNVAPLTGSVDRNDFR